MEVSSTHVARCVQHRAAQSAKYLQQFSQALRKIEFEGGREIFQSLCGGVARKKLL